MSLNGRNGKETTLTHDNEDMKTKFSPRMTLIINYRKNIVLPQTSPTESDNSVGSFSVTIIFTLGPDNSLLLGGRAGCPVPCRMLQSIPGPLCTRCQ